ncbi:MAG: hypothetical protein EBR82_49855 [Caulobacteraceae bacterium]|nr:hypothetical protein [Caulobacteraceae bacterium]
MTEYLEYLSKQIHEERTRIIEDLGDGKAQDHGDYKFSCGVVRGLLVANNLIMELAERMENSDE